MGETTEIIRKRIRHWKTTLAGIAGIVCPVVSLFVPPEYATKVLAAGCMLSGTGLIAAADAKAKVSVEGKRP